MQILNKNMIFLFYYSSLRNVMKVYTSCNILNVLWETIQIWNIKYISVLMNTLIWATL